MHVRAGGHAGHAVLIALAAMVAPACKGRAQPALDQEESQERLNVISNPSVYLDTGGFAFDDEADDQEQLLAMTVWNKSRFSVRGLEGDVIWLDDDGKRIGSSRFGLEGAVPAHGSTTFSVSEGTMTSGPLRGGAMRVSIVFTRVKVAD
jgi:hypothetical protein